MDMHRITYRITWLAMVVAAAASGYLLLARTTSAPASGDAPGHVQEAPPARGDPASRQRPYARRGDHIRQ